VKLASYVADGREAFGAVVGDGVVTMNDRLKGGYATLKQALVGGALAEIAGIARSARPDRQLAALRLLPVIPDPAKIICAGYNYRSHVAEMGQKVPQKPSVFARFADTLIGHDGAMIRPSVSEEFDYEGELAVVIGRSGRHIPESRALEHVAGYTCFVDGSVRDYQKISVTAGKNFRPPARSARGWSRPTKFPTRRVWC